MVGTSNQSVPEMAIDIGHIGFPTLHTGHRAEVSCNV